MIKNGVILKTKKIYILILQILVMFNLNIYSLSIHITCPNKVNCLET
jgi:hypothetical protein